MLTADLQLVPRSRICDRAWQYTYIPQIIIVMSPEAHSSNLEWFHSLLVSFALDRRILILSRWLHHDRQVSPLAVWGRKVSKRQKEIGSVQCVYIYWHEDSRPGAACTVQSQASCGHADKSKSRRKDKHLRTREPHRANITYSSVWKWLMKSHARTDSAMRPETVS
jgi:hypothetical protein